MRNKVFWIQCAEMEKEHDETDYAQHYDAQQHSEELDCGEWMSTAMGCGRQESVVESCSWYSQPSTRGQVAAEYRQAPHSVEHWLLECPVLREAVKLVKTFLGVKTYH